LTGIVQYRLIADLDPRRLGRLALGVSVNLDHFRSRTASGALVVAVGLLLALMGAAPATAVAGFTTNAYVNVRSGPSTSATLVGGINGGTAISIACQTTGTSYGGSVIWNRLETPWGGYYIHDYFVNGTPYNAFDPRIQRCPAPAGSYRASAAVNVRTGASSTTPLAGTLPGGHPVVIECQALGSSYGGSRVWDKLASPYGGHFIHDYFVNGTPYGKFDSGLPRCGAAVFPNGVDCQKVLFVGLRGSGQEAGDAGLGPQDTPVQETRDRLAERGANLEIRGILYPAHDVYQLKYGGVQGLYTWLAGKEDGANVTTQLVVSRG
jgi:uncharacterized protein YraI